MRIYFDSSAFAKRYIEEKGSEIVLKRLAEATEVILSILCVPEVISALNRKRRERRVTSQLYHEVKKQMARDIEESVIIDLSPRIVSQTIFCLEKFVVKTLDALHLASALEAHCHLFVTADDQQGQAAQAAGLAVENVYR